MSIQRAIFIVNLALITLGAYFGAGLFYQIWAMQVKTGRLEPLAQSKAATTPGEAVKPYSDYRPILQRDLFKTQKASGKPDQDAKLNVEDMAETTLQLKLWGTVSGDAQQSYAVIEDTSKREQNLYRVGDSVQEATVKAILRAKVVLNVGGQDQVLAMEELEQGRSALRPGRPVPGGRVPLAAPPGRGQRISLRRNMINEAVQDVSKLMTEIKIQPNESGLSLSQIKPNSIFRRMGLRNGDVLKSVDGQQIRSVDDALRLYESLKTSDSVTVELQRRGSDRTINYNIR
jgi:general secretion pathway protein C